MKRLSMSEDLVPVKEFRSNLAAWFRKAMETGRPVIVTQHGKAAAVVMSPKAIDELREENEFMRAVVKGLRALDEGRIVDDDDVWSEVDQIIKKAGSPREDSVE